MSGRAGPRLAGRTAAADVVGSFVGGGPSAACPDAVVVSDEFMPAV
jgi:hypothetical protein